MTSSDILSEKSEITKITKSNINKASDDNQILLVKTHYGFLSVSKIDNLDFEKML